MESFLCLNCERAAELQEYYTKPVMLRHYREKHVGLAYRWTCDTCGNGFSSKGWMQIHSNAAHGVPLPPPPPPEMKKPKKCKGRRKKFQKRETRNACFLG